MRFRSLSAILVPLAVLALRCGSAIPEKAHDLAVVCCAQPAVPAAMPETRAAGAA